MNVYLTTFYLMLALSCPYLYEGTKTNYAYSETHTNKNINSIDSNGSVLINECLIKKRVFVNGAVSIENSRIGDVIVNGQLDVRQSHAATVTANGAMSATNSVFLGLVSVASENILFNSCELNDLYVRKTENPSDVQTVKLLGESVVNKNIIFERPGGRVMADKDVQIYGKIRNGRIIYQIPID